MKSGLRESIRAFSRLMLSVATIGIAGAGGCGPQRGALEGSVTYDGVPVTEGLVMLFPTDGHYRNSSSVKIVEGRYRIEGIVPGDRRVSLDNLVIRTATGDSTPVTPGRNALPETITVEAGRHTLDFPLGSGSGSTARPAQR